MSNRVSLLRKAALAASLFGIATVSQAGILGTAAASWTGYAPNAGDHAWNPSGNLNVTWNYGASSLSVNTLGFLRWLQTSTDNSNAPSPGPHYELRGLGQAAGNAPDGSADSFYTICGQFRGIESPIGFGVWNSDDPMLALGTTRGGGVVGADWSNLGTTTNFEHAFASGNNLRAAGFQVAVWAAIYGDGSEFNVGDDVVGNLLTLGGFTASSTDSDWATVLGYAEEYYDYAWEDGFGWRSLWLDSGIGNETGQDQYTITPGPPQSVPEPFTMALGLAGAGAYIRRRVRAKRA